jgi:hypothetical protein
LACEKHQSPALALAFASVLAASAAWDIGRLSVRRDPRVVAPPAAAAAASRIVMGVTMAFMLLIMV